MQKNIYQKKYDIAKNDEKIKYFREIKAYQYFNKNNIKFVPNLISYDEGVLSIEFINGMTLFDHLEQNIPFNYQKIVKQIASIDGYLFLNKINVLGLHLKDFMVTQNHKLIFYDFEYSFLNSSFKNILYDQCLIYANLKGLENQKDNLVLKHFIFCLKNNKKLFVKINKRRFINKLIVFFRKISNKRLDEPITHLFRY